MAAPTVADLKAFLVNRCGISATAVIATDDATLTKALNWALAQLQKETGYRPFIAPAASDYKVMVRGGRGLFSNGAVGTVVVSQDGNVYTADLDYRLEPLNSSPKEYIVWLRTLNPSKPLTVNAQWGYAADYPDDVWEALLMLAAAFAIVAFVAGQAGLLGSDWTDGDVSQHLAVQSSAGQIDQTGIASVAPGILAAEARRVFGQYKRTVVWG